MLKNPIVQSVLTVLAVIVFCKLVAPKIPVIGSYISISSSADVRLLTIRNQKETSL